MTSFEQIGIRRRTLLATTALVGVGGLVASQATSFAAPADAPQAAATRRTPRTIRLTTGDRVLLRESRIVDIEPAGGAGRPARTPFLRYHRAGDEYVVPAGELARIRSGEIDERLFNVTGLVRAGYADARRADPSRISPIRPTRPSRSNQATADETFQVTVRLWDRIGKNPPANEGYNLAYFLDADTGEMLGVVAGHGEQASVPAGRYLVVAPILTSEADADFPSRTLLALPGLRVTADTEIELDARIAERVAVTLPDRDAETTMGIVGAATLLPDDPSGFAFLWFSLDRYSDVYVGSPAGAHDPDFVFIHRHMLQQPELQVTVTAPERLEVKAEWYVPSPRLLGSHKLVGVSVAAATPEELAGLDLAGKVALLNLPADDAGEFVPRLRQLRDAGAVAALHVGPAVPSPRGEEVPLPTGYAIGAAAQSLAGLKLGGTADLAWRGLDTSPYRYDLSFPTREAIPAKQQHTLRRADLAQLRVTYASQGVPVVGSTGASAFFFGIGLGAGGGALVRRPTVREEYVTPGEWALNSVGWFGGEQSWQVPQTYQAGRHYVVDWHKAMLGPALPRGSSDSGYYQVARDGDTISSVLLMFTDGQQNPGELWYPWETEDLTITGSQELYRDGTLLGRVDDDAFATFTVPSDPGRYELRAETSRRSAWWQRATDVSAVWTFESAQTDTPSLLPLLTLHATADVDETNTRAAGRPFLLPIRVYRQDLGGFAPVRSINVDYSLQDGKNWQQAKVVPSGPAEWTARIGKPGKGLLSLRINVSDRDGNTVTQTVIRAVQLR
jgi:hypothetical protein